MKWATPGGNNCHLVFATTGNMCFYVAVDQFRTLFLLVLESYQVWTTGLWWVLSYFFHLLSFNVFIPCFFVNMFNILSVSSFLQFSSLALFFFISLIRRFSYLEYFSFSSVFSLLYTSVFILDVGSLDKLR